MLSRRSSHRTTRNPASSRASRSNIRAELSGSRIDAEVHAALHLNTELTVTPMGLRGWGSNVEFEAAAQLQHDLGELYAWAFTEGR